MSWGRRIQSGELDDFSNKNNWTVFLFYFTSISLWNFKVFIRLSSALVYPPILKMYVVAMIRNVKSKFKLRVVHVSCLSPQFVFYVSLNCNGWQYFILFLQEFFPVKFRGFSRGFAVVSLEPSPLILAGVSKCEKAETECQMFALILFWWAVLIMSGRKGGGFWRISIVLRDVRLHISPQNESLVCGEPRV